MSRVKIEDMVEIRLKESPKIIKETLSRIGIANKKSKILYPSCYLYKNFDSYYIVHFKELFLLTRPDGYMNLCDEDIARKNSIIYCLLQWGLIDLEGVEYENNKVISVPEKIQPHDKFVFVLKNSMKHEWQILHKFNVNTISMPE
jgi:hypothetical protein